MIRKETAEAIWCAYREIEAGEKLLADMAAARERSGPHPDPLAPTLRDAFGRLQQLQLGIPSGDSGHRLFGVSPPLAESIIRAHIANKQAALAEANERARIEASDTPQPVGRSPIDDDAHPLEARYVVLKISDLERYCSRQMRECIEAVTVHVRKRRFDDGRRNLRCVVVERDWPEYKPTVSLLLARIRGESHVEAAELQKDD